MSDLKLNNVSKIFGTERVIKSLNLEVPYGEFLVVVGPSGCGKSTLLRMLAGLENPSDGNIEIDNKDPSSGNYSSFDIAIQKCKSAQGEQKKTFRDILDFCDLFLLHLILRTR